MTSLTRFHVGGLGIGLALMLLCAAPGRTVELDPSVLAFKLPDQIKWRDPLGNAPVNQAVLHGDPTKPGLYVVLNRFKPNNFSRPHFHPNDRFITVVKGTWWIGTGSKFDPQNATVPMPAGSFVTHYGKQVHYDGAKDEEAWVLIVGEGPRRSRGSRRRSSGATLQPYHRAAWTLQRG